MKLYSEDSETASIQSIMKCKRFIMEKWWDIFSWLVFRSSGRPTLFFKMNSEDIFHAFILHPPERRLSSVYA